MSILDRIRAWLCRCPKVSESDAPPQPTAPRMPEYIESYAAITPHARQRMRTLQRVLDRLDAPYTSDMAYDTSAGTARVGWIDIEQWQRHEYKYVYGESGELWVTCTYRTDYEMHSSEPAFVGVVDTLLSESDIAIIKQALADALVQVHNEVSNYRIIELR